MECSKIEKQWQLSGFPEKSPKACDVDESTIYFPSLRRKYHLQTDALSSKVPQRRVISICVCCYNEEASALRRTVESFKLQKLPSNVNLEIVIVMDGTQQMPTSMTSYLTNMFGIVSTNEDIFTRRNSTYTRTTSSLTLSTLGETVHGVSSHDLKSDPSLPYDSELSALESLFDPNIETILIEPQYETSKIPQGDDGLSFMSSLQQESVSVSLILKKSNQRKSNSQMWWIGSHAAACQGEYLLTTDCGIHFPPKSVQRMMARLDQDECLAAVTARKDIMSASMQGDKPYEMFTDPFSYALRQIQIFDCKLDYLVWHLAFDSMGFSPCLHGPCSFFRSSSFGTINQGVAGQYFRFINEEAKDLISGNVQLVEDRIPSTLLVFRHRSTTPHSSKVTKNLQSNQTTDKTPSSTTTIDMSIQELFSKTGSVYEASFNYDAEKPLRQLVKQRRRWVNGTFAMYLWILKKGWIWKGHQPLRVKLFAFLFCILNVIQLGFLRLAGPAMMAIITYNCILALPVVGTDSLEGISAFMTSDTKNFTSGAASISAFVATAIYLIFYVVFMICHTPKAVPVKDKNGNPTKRWRNDRSSAYQPTLFCLSIVISVLQICLSITVLAQFFIRLGLKGSPLGLRLIVFAYSAPYVLVSLKRVAFVVLMFLTYVSLSIYHPFCVSFLTTSYPHSHMQTTRLLNVGNFRWYLQ